jgi:hypothetical protein
MVGKLVKIGVVGTAGTMLLSFFVFGREAKSYFDLSARNVRDSIKNSVPVEFELQRARDMLEEIIPEMQANIGLIAQEEVEIARLRSDIERSEEAMQEKQERITRLTNLLQTSEPTFVLGRFEYTRNEVKGQLAREFDRFKEAEIVLAGKKRLVKTREKSLHSAMEMLNRTRAEKARLEDQIAALESKHRLVQTASAGSTVQLDNSKLAQTEKLISDIKNRLDVAERVLAHEARFVEPMDIDVVDEKELLAEVEQHLGRNETRQARSTSAPAAESLAMQGALTGPEYQD